MTFWVRRGRNMPLMTSNLAVTAQRSQLLDTSHVADLLGVTPRTVRRYIAEEPTFPRPIRITARTLRWRAQDIDIWLSTQTTPGTEGAAVEVRV